MNAPGCTGKVRYDRRDEAKRAKKQTRNWPGERARKLHVYWCQFCDGWHLTTWSTNRAEMEETNARKVEAAPTKFPGIPSR